MDGQSSYLRGYKFSSLLLNWPWFSRSLWVASYRFAYSFFFYHIVLILSKSNDVIFEISLIRKTFRKFDIDLPMNHFFRLGGEKRRTLKIFLREQVPLRATGPSQSIAVIVDRII